MTKESLNKYLQELADILPSVLDDKTTIFDGEGNLLSLNDPTFKLDFIIKKLMDIEEYLKVEQRITGSLRVAPVSTEKQTHNRKMEAQ